MIKNRWTKTAALAVLAALAGVAGYLAAARCESKEEGQISGGMPELETEGGQSLELPSRYDCRDDGKAPGIKSQGGRGTCWALTATSALEASLMPGEHKVFSADHFSLNNGFEAPQKEGGDYKMIMAYLSGWYGPVYESDDPYGDDKTADNIPARVHVQQITLLEGKKQEEFKRAVLQSGPVQTSLYMDRKATAKALPYYNAQTCAYYYTEKKSLNHDVLILGWDDEFPASSFKTDPGMDGAFICQNTWGKSFGDDGVFYVSYADANAFTTGLVYSRVESPGNYSRIYQNDVCGWQGRQGYDSPECWFAGVFTAQSAEKLSAAGFYSLGNHTEYEIYIVHEFKNEDSFIHKKYLTGGTIEGMGYYTIDLPMKEELAEGERFAVAVHVTTPGVDKPVAVELKKDSYTQNVTTENKESYISLTGGSWENTQEDFETNICLKAYTDVNGEDGIEVNSMTEEDILP